MANKPKVDAKDVRQAITVERYLAFLKTDGERIVNGLPKNNPDEVNAEKWNTELRFTSVEHIIGITVNPETGKERSPKTVERDGSIYEVPSPLYFQVKDGDANLNRLLAYKGMKSKDCEAFSAIATCLQLVANAQSNDGLKQAIEERTGKTLAEVIVSFSKSVDDYGQAANTTLLSNLVKPSIRNLGRQWVKLNTKYIGPVQRLVATDMGISEMPEPANVEQVNTEQTETVPA